MPEEGAFLHTYLSLSGAAQHNSLVFLLSHIVSHPIRLTTPNPNAVELFSLMWSSYISPQDILT
jgi:hypothetical protein